MICLIYRAVGKQDEQNSEIPKYPSGRFGRTGTPDNVELYLTLHFTTEESRQTLDLEAETVEQRDRLARAFKHWLSSREQQYLDHFK